MLKFLFLSVIVLLTGCGGAPDCDSPAGLEKVRDIIYYEAKSLIRSNTIKNPFDEFLFDSSEIDAGFTDEEIAVLSLYVPKMLITANIEYIKRSSQAQIKQTDGQNDERNLDYFVYKNINQSKLKIHFSELKKQPDIVTPKRTFTNVCQATITFEPVGKTNKTNLSLQLVYSVNAPPAPSHPPRKTLYVPVHFFKASPNLTLPKRIQNDKIMLIVMGAAKDLKGTPKSTTPDTQLFNLVLQGFRMALEE